jgi:hypothetical protein
LNDKYLQSDENQQQISLFRPRKHVKHRRLCSDSQARKRRQLAYGAWNRARQLIVGQVPAIIDENTAQINTPPPRLFQLTGA